MTHQINEKKDTKIYKKLNNTLLYINVGLNHLLNRPSRYYQKEFKQDKQHFIQAKFGDAALFYNDEYSWPCNVVPQEIFNGPMKPYEKFSMDILDEK